MEYVTKKCPYCKKAYQRFVHKSEHYGCPIVNCPSCGGQFYDKDYIERALQPYKPTSYAMSLAASLLSVTFLFAFLAAIIWYFQGAWYVYLIFGSLYLVWTTMITVQNKADTDKDNRIAYTEWLESEKRLMNREYAIFLKERGVKVPEKYLE